MADFLELVIAQKRKELETKRGSLPFSELLRKVKKWPFSSSFSHSLLRGKTIIAEIKRASPSKGALFSGDSIQRLAHIYEENGASAISVITEEKYFQGSPEDLQKIREGVHLPLLRKDFIIDEYQIVETRVSGADALLLIASLLPAKKLEEFLKLTDDLGVDAVVEVHTQDDIQKALAAEAKIIGINNRNLRTMKVDLQIAQRLLPLIPDSKIKIVESGIRNEKDLLSYHGLKVNAFLVGEALLTSSDPADTLKRFCTLLRKE